MLDTGATCEAVLDDIAFDLNLDIETRPCNLSTFNAKSYKSGAEFTRFTVEPLDGSFAIDVENSLIGSVISAKNELPYSVSDTKGFDYLTDVSLDELDDKTVGLILGAKFAHTWIGKEIRYADESKPLAVKTAFGWSLVGPPLKESDRETGLNAGFCLLDAEVVNDLVESDIKRQLTTNFM